MPTSRPGPVELPVLQSGERPVRADAARNRARILKAARRLFAARGVQSVSMDDIAAEANVGKGTLYRRFGDRASLAVALLEGEHVALQEDFVRGAPPLGPGAPPRERLDAFFAALSCHLERHYDLIAEAERSMPAGQAYAWGVYTAWHAHVRILLHELDPQLDSDTLAHMLLAPFRAEIHRYLSGDTGSQSQERLLAGLAALLDGLQGRAGLAPTAVHR